MGLQPISPDSMSEKSGSTSSTRKPTYYGSTTVMVAPREAAGKVEASTKASMCLPWLFNGLVWLPITFGICLSLSVLVPYCIAVGLGHVSPGFPYISDTGADPPESCIFGQLLNISSALAFGIIYVRYKQLAEYYREVPSRVLVLNKVCFVLGIMASFGLSLVANFQESNVVIVHMIGAIGCFGLGAIYSLIMAWISYKLCPHHSSIAMCHFRLLLGLLSVIFFITTFLFSSLASSKWKGKDPKKWLPEDGGFELHIVSTASEWGLAIAFLLYLSTFAKEFHKVQIAAEIRHCERLLEIPSDPNS